MLQIIKYLRMIILLQALLWLCSSQNSSTTVPVISPTAAQCQSNCEACSRNIFFCDSCSEQFELTELGKCNAESNIQNCQLHGSRNNCLVCKPTFRLFNICVRMYDGCLIAAPEGTCSKCVNGAFSNQYRKCSIKYINCLNVDQQGQCSKCQNQYRLQNGRCQNFQPSCRERDAQTGLCLNCNDPYILNNYKCVNKSQVLKNCYLMNDNLTGCMYCKNGYQLYQNKCYTLQYVNTKIYGEFAANRFQFHCAFTQFKNKTSKKCEQIPRNCEKFDYGFMKCAFCSNSNLLIGDICLDATLRFCQKFNNQNPYLCEQCKPKFYLNYQKQCSPYPLFCDRVANQRCVKCIQQFLLNQRGLCEDPNCQKQHPITYQCESCKTSYIFNKTTGICFFKDIYCEEENLPQNPIACKKCKTDYIYDLIKKRCKFKDPDCKIFSDKQVCLECNAGHYLNSLSNYCMELPFKCQSVDSLGNCRYCAEGYALLKSYQCSRINSSYNCDQFSEINTNVCIKCKQQYYLDIETRLCLSLPILCKQFDELKKACLKCNERANLINGKCYDKLCEYFGENAQCLGCKQGYTFNREGNCILQTNDLNCKQFANGICKRCSDRYYFDKNWRCIPVNDLCKDYDPNNGACTSCHNGYSIEKKLCILTSLIKDTCKQYKQNTKQCITCQKNYNLFQGKCNDYIIGCLQKDYMNNCVKCIKQFILEDGRCKSSTQQQFPDLQLPPSDKNCLLYDKIAKRCSKCIKRMYFENKQKLCLQIDENCQDFKEDGECIKCYSGYTVSDISTKQCVKSKPKDSNCKIISNNPSDTIKCLECYQGFYYSLQQQKCVVTNLQCKTSDQNNGQCLSCWDGYGLIKGQCIQIENCLNYINNQCIQCLPEYFLRDQLCIKNNASFSTKENFEIVNVNPQTSTSLCLKYSQTDPIKCIECIKATVYDQRTKKCVYPLYGQNEFCLIYQNQVCTKCQPYYILSNYQCVKLDTYCIKYNPQITQCLQCYGNKIPQKLNCI